MATYNMIQGPRSPSNPSDERIEEIVGQYASSLKKMDLSKGVRTFPIGLSYSRDELEKGLQRLCDPKVQQKYGLPSLDMVAYAKDEKGPFGYAVKTGVLPQSDLEKLKSATRTDCSGVCYSKTDLQY